MLRKIFCVLVLTSIFLISGCQDKTALQGSDCESMGDSVYLKGGCLSTSQEEPVSNSDSILESRADGVSLSSTATTSEYITENIISEKEADKENTESKTESMPSKTNNQLFPGVSENNKSEAEDIASGAASSDEDFTVAAARRVEELLNSERAKLGVPERTVLDGLTRLAVFRANQLTVQFSHSWTDENGITSDGADYAATVLKYGKYYSEKETRFDSVTGKVIETGNIIERYSYGGGENCGTGSAFGMSSEGLAKNIVDAFKSSTGHWSSLMSADKSFEGIGIVIFNGEWYCSINSSAENYG